jgi:hypothetical protein
MWNVNKLELYGIDLLIELEPPASNPLLTIVSHSGTVREVGPAHEGQADPVKIGNRVIVLAESSRYLAKSVRW